MPKIFRLSSSLVIGLLGLLAACNQDPEPPVLELVSGSNYVAGNRKLTGGTPVRTAVYAQAPTENTSLTKFEVFFEYDSIATTPAEVIFLDSTLAANTTEFTMVVHYTPRNLIGKERWHFVVTDSQGKKYTRLLRFTTTSANSGKSGFYTFSNLILSRLKTKRTKADSVGLAGLAAEDGTAYPIYTLKQAAVNAKIDLVFNQTADDKPNLSIATPNANPLHITGLNTDAFTKIINADNLRAAYPAGAGLPNSGALKVNQIIAFKTVKNKIALLHVKRSYRTADSLMIDVKAEK